MLVLWGDDFAHRVAEKSFNSLDMIIKLTEEYLEKNQSDPTQYILKYSTMGEYLEGVLLDARMREIDWPVERGDFWMYNYRSDKNAYWTGYFSTQPDFKGRATAFGDFAQSAQLITALSVELEEDQELEDALQRQRKRLETLSIMQHHDAMTGTHPHDVGLDYHKMMTNRENEALQLSKGGILAKGIEAMAKAHGLAFSGDVVKCELDGYQTLDCKQPLLSGQQSILTFYNPNVQSISGVFLKVQR